ncbi:MAG: hypothetical protein H0V43_06220 [Gemmatimonadales bacterium]|nr:hypothetical protein [Gemmatimonadales bacterium]
MSPSAVPGGLQFRAGGAGGSHTCGVTTGGAAYCWGDNDYGQLGNGATTDRSSPVAVAGALQFAMADPGGSFSCGVTTGSRAYCWGLNSSGQLGNGRQGENQSTPVRVGPL